jgi:hypothetical protein
MATFEYRVNAKADVETIQAEGYNLDTKDRKLTFYDKDNNQLASYATGEGAYVKRK